MALVLAGGGDACSDIEHLRCEPALFGQVASQTTAYRTLTGIDDAAARRGVGSRGGRARPGVGGSGRGSGTAAGARHRFHAGGDPLGEHRRPITRAYVRCCARPATGSRCGPAAARQRRREPHRGSCRTTARTASSQTLAAGHRRGDDPDGGTADGCAPTPRGAPADRPRLQGPQHHLFHEHPDNQRLRAPIPTLAARRRGHPAPSRSRPGHRAHRRGRLCWPEGTRLIVRREAAPRRAAHLVDSPSEGRPRSTPT